ncbi:MAG: sugar ABC transporter permease [Anaerolineae bacterium]|nr:sugar ABC transporter permease [Anaerolineae bacterium]MDW8072370.1 sugar ABC transporter permease [Anaerolineae bacterium]
MRYSKGHVILFLTPLGLVVLFMYAMMLWTVYVSMNNWVGMAPSWNFNGLANYFTLFRMERFWINLQNNVLWMVIFIPPTAFLGLVLAYALELSGRAEAFFRPIFLYPMALSFVVTGTLWAWMYDPGSGVINALLKGIGLGALAQPWIASPKQALYCMIGAAIWQYTGFAMTLYLAAIRDISREIIEASRVDGASDLQVFIHIVVPNVQHATMIVVAMLTLFSLKVFDLVWVMTMGGPGNSTEVLSYFMFVATFRQQLVGLGAAISVIILILAVIVVIPYASWSMRRMRA